MPAFKMTIIEMGSVGETSYETFQEALEDFCKAVTSYRNSTIIVTRHGWNDKLMAYDSAERLELKSPR